MKSNLLRALVPMALVCGTLAAQDVFELHGYVRSGVGRSSNGGEQVSFFMANTGGAPTSGPGYRLGNETDNYLELAMDVNAFQQGSKSFKLHFRPTFRQYNALRDASADAGGNVDNAKVANPNQIVYLREAYGEATGVLGNGPVLKDATLWVGRRFYQRQDLHMRDQWYWNNSGDGFGLENMDFGAFKMHYAYVQHDTGNLDSDWNNGAIRGVVKPYSQWVGNAGQVVIGSHDLRFSDIRLWSGASLTLGLQYNDAKPSSRVASDSNNNDGTQFNVILNQANFFGGDNRVYACYGTGNTFWNWYNPEVKTENKWYQVMDNYYIKPTANFDMMGTLIYRKQNGEGSQAGNTNAWTSIGIRPAYYFTKHISVAAEVGIDRLKFDNETEARRLTKSTVALQFSPNPSGWSRPVIRFFVTKANWNDKANSWNKIGEGQFGTATSGTTFGAQVEAWW